MEHRNADLHKPKEIHCHLYRMVPIEIHVTFASIVGKKVNVQPKVMSFNALFFS